MEKDVWALSMGSQITCPNFHNRGRAKRLKNRTSGMKWRLCCLTPSWENGINTLGQAVWGMFVQSSGSGVTFTEEHLAYTEKWLGSAHVQGEVLSQLD